MKNPFLCIKKSQIIALFMCLVLLLSHFVLYFKLESYKKVVDSLCGKIFNGFNYKSSEFEYNEKDSNIFFVSNSKDYVNLGLKLPHLKLPSNEDFEINEGVITFNNEKNFVITCAGEGVVRNVGYQENGLKYVEIRHSGNIITRYENLKVVGVGTNFLVKNINALGVSCGEAKFVFKIIKNGNILTNYTIENGEIKWQN